jgi:pimeloyl-ACP methyl ester carboxylesterase
MIIKSITTAFYLLVSTFAFAFNSDSLFTETPVVLHTTTGDIFGTLTTPKTSAKIPVALIIAGSGPTDRNGNNPMMKNESLRYLAYGLASNNIASLRFDKRAIAESKAAAKSEADLRFEDYINDARQWMGLLKKDKRFSKLVVIGHSEGSLIGMVAALNDADGFVSIAGAGRPASQIIKEQLATQPQVIKDSSYAIIDSLVMGKTVAHVNLMLYSLFRPSVQPYMISWFKYDPAKEIQKLKIPVLVVQGTNDVQVPVEDARLLAKANPKAQLFLINNMNHVLKIVEGDRQANLATYSNPDLPVSHELINAVVDFIKKIK